MPTLTSLKIPRCHSHYTTTAARVDLHTFVDASEEAFSAATYLRIEHHGEIHVSFVCGKTRVSPNKLLTIPRLELSAAILGMRLCNSVVECHTLPIADRIYWSDSKTVLHWLRSDPCRHKEFVAYRIAEILQGSKASQWRWVPSKSNLADDATRGGHSLGFHINNKWIKGPAFLRLPETEWPQQPNDISDHLSTEEIRPKYLLSTSRSSKPPFDATKFSSFLKLRRTMAWALRFINACRRKPTERGELTAVEVKEAEDLVCRRAQGEAYGEDVECLRRNLPIRKSSQLYQMTPYLDEFGLVRSLGRIDAATTVPFETRRPVIMPRDHAVTKLLVSDYHRRFRHQNDDTIVNEIRQRFWVPGLRSAVKAAKGQCQLCRIRRAKPQTPLMGQLPEDRVTPFVRPFTFTGLDYFGPVNVAVRRRTEKRWVALFTCLTIRAVHLEIAADLSTDSCILCIRNFVNRRGTPLRIRTDNGTNFLGARKELLTSDIFDNEAIKAELSSVGIEWVFNCPLNPHAGGCWERLVQSTKRALAYTLKEVTPKIEVLYSALMEAENIINSRPLTHLPITTEDEEPLTPNHFLLGVPNSTQTPGPIDERALCLRKRWRVSQQLKNRFWNRWVREYLPVLTRRCKWFQSVPPLKVGDLVLECDVTKARSRWTRGRIIRVFPGPDGQVRSADVKTASGVLRRPAVRLALLDVSEAGVSTRAPHGGWDVDK